MTSRGAAGSGGAPCQSWRTGVAAAPALVGRLGPGRSPRSADGSCPRSGRSCRRPEAEGERSARPPAARPPSVRPSLPGCCRREPRPGSCRSSPLGPRQAGTPRPALAQRCRRRPPIPAGTCPVATSLGSHGPRATMQTACPASERVPGRPPPLPPLRSVRASLSCGPSRGVLPACWLPLPAAAPFPGAQLKTLLAFACALRSLCSCVLLWGALGFLGGGGDGVSKRVILSNTG